MYRATQNKSDDAFKMKANSFVWPWKEKLDEGRRYVSFYENGTYLIIEPVRHKSWQWPTKPGGERNK